MYLEIVVGERGIMREVGAELVEAREDNKWHGVMLSRKRHQVTSTLGHDTSISQNCMRSDENLRDHSDLELNSIHHPSPSTNLCRRSHIVEEEQSMPGTLKPLILILLAV